MDNFLKVFDAMVSYYSGDPKRIQHFTKVHSYARIIGLKEGLPERTQYILELAALVHDIGIKNAELKYHSSMGKYQEQEGPSEAKVLLISCGIDPDAIDRICYLVGHHHTFKDIDGLDYQILVEADFLVNLYEDNLPEKSARSVMAKIFKTKAGIEMLKTMYKLSDEPQESAE